MWVISDPSQKREGKRKERNMKDTVKPVLNGYSKIDKAKVLKTNGSLMKVESIAECSL